MALGQAPKLNAFVSFILVHSHITSNITFHQQWKRAQNYKYRIMAWLHVKILIWIYVSITHRATKHLWIFITKMNCVLPNPCQSTQIAASNAVLDSIWLDRPCEIVCCYQNGMDCRRIASVLTLTFENFVNVFTRNSALTEIVCPVLPEVKFGSFDPADCISQKVTHGTNCTLTCDDGFELKGPSVKTCGGKRTGVWSNRNKYPTCVGNCRCFGLLW